MIEKETGGSSGAKTKLIIPEGYRSKLEIRETEAAIKFIKDVFERELSAALNLERISAPLFVRPESGLNDNLNGIEKPVSFHISAVNGGDVEIVHSLAKWKRIALKRYGFKAGEGLYTDMNAIRCDEETDNLHSIYVDQWDWEKVINRADKNEATLINTVKRIYGALRSTEDKVCSIYPQIDRYLPEEIFFITSQELEDMYPSQPPKERENLIAAKKGAVFVMQIGRALKSGIRHDGRAPDYDDWTLNGDIILWYPVLGIAFEISSMGIRVDEDTLLMQLKASGCEERLKLKFHSDLAAGLLPYTVGGGIGQSRLCMYFLNKAHIGEVQASVWPDSMVEECGKGNITLL